MKRAVPRPARSGRTLASRQTHDSNRWLMDRGDERRLLKARHRLRSPSLRFIGYKNHGPVLGFAVLRGPRGRSETAAGPKCCEWTRRIAAIEDQPGRAPYG